MMENKNEYTERILLSKLKRETVDKLHTIIQYVESDTKYTWTDSNIGGIFQISEDIDDLILNWKED